MAVIGTFGSFTAARLGIYASQSSLNVTGNNIANINTKGYTRQRMDLVSLHSYGDARYANSFNLNIGYGVLADGVSQLRDPFMDIRYRNENANVGAYETTLECLQQLSHVLDEVGKGTEDFGIMENQFNDLLAQIANFHGKVGSVEYDTTVRGSAENLTKLFNSYAKSLQTVQDNELKRLKEDVNSVNSLLTQIRNLSEEIREAGIHGDKALELRDARNVYIDELSAYMKIDVSYDMEKIDEFNSVERINISIADSGTPPIKLIQGIYGTQLSMPEMTAKRNPNYDPSNPQSNRYISQESTPGNIKYTNIEREALKNANGTAITNDDAGEVLIKAMGGFVGIPQANKYDPAKAPYLMADGTPTDDPEQAEQVVNAKAGSDENRLWMSLEPLVDRRGEYMRDQYHKEITESVDLTDTQLYGSLQALREFLTEKGEFSSKDDISFDPKATQKRGVLYYRKSLDALAQKFAEKFNEANRLDMDVVSEAYQVDSKAVPPVFINAAGAPITDKDGNPITAQSFDDLAADMKELAELKKQVASGALKDKPDELKQATERIAVLEADMAERTEAAYANMEILRNEGLLTEKWSFYNGGVLFSNNGDKNDPTGINAANITISKSWSTGEVRILNTKKADDLDHSSANDNIYHLITTMKTKFDYRPSEIVPDAADGDKKYFTGTFQERLADMNDILSVNQQTTVTLYNSYATSALDLDNRRQSVSGVDLNDEATNMMVFQKSYAAACQLMTTLDSMLDKLINGTIR